MKRVDEDRGEKGAFPVEEITNHFNAHKKVTSPPGAKICVRLNHGTLVPVKTRNHVPMEPLSSMGEIPTICHKPVI